MLDFSPTDIDFLIKEWPERALRLKHICARLTNIQFEQCVKAVPWQSLMFKHACDRLSDIQFDDCAKKYPLALYVWSRLNVYQKAWVKKCLVP